MGRDNQSSGIGPKTEGPDDDADFTSTPSILPRVTEEEMNGGDVELALAISASLAPNQTDGPGLSWMSGRGTRISEAKSAQSIILERTLQDVVRWSEWVRPSFPSRPSPPKGSSVTPSLWSMTSGLYPITPSSSIRTLVDPWSKAMQRDFIPM
ncbi:hypothetical protein BJ684DRAFT_19002 [Piptocephalis cylindrospora]|uniref:Uncharacterized protein n=1 Tax=Piptocephalis cylindrospora TaxID=1907219 RepID=A0A4P9Y6D8_9FUNG|nr:hypothetical protein BJ684DRAFT_19002 [Piptocephalis cylindrospora]|eukprot:RKP14607.1 hypothetical protein BJ684DRAFT_19002 [Piptocephalis cylindrospora]